MHVFITGASSGIGQALARHYAARGAVLGLLARRGPALQAFAATLPGRHHCYEVDVRDRQALHGAALDFLRAAGGQVDVVVANAGISRGTLTEEPDDFAAFEDILATNMLAMVATFEPFVAPMRAARRGTLVGMASVAGIRGLPGAAGYCASKAAAISYCESLRNELAADGIRVVTLLPGYVRTPLTDRNPFPMPFLLDADTFARRAARAIDAGRRYAIVPWQMAIVGRLLRWVPAPVFDLFARRAPRKPRGVPTDGLP
ncbi:SDR family oxidoreductase [Verticiella sediminum]|uniref:SDR family oxidoreductase n=1 Tax=Verticiella sediminum TaxID=1247510 RepID=A0A556AEC8_9BURK|nr:SDR family oxidoreductase [Verticiella sediminum]TSH91248.1 SDR family oxidoreductase [Verticiella sediminum]